MGVHINAGRSIATIYCSTTDWSFGPVFGDSDDHDAEERAESFLRFIRIDPRKASDNELQALYSAWLVQEEEQWRREEED